MCPMAEILHHKGYELTGSDINESDTLERIRSYGIPVAMGHRAENIGNAECVVYTAACKQDNPELVAAREKGIPTLERSVMLGLLARKFKRPVAVSGTHGKTTTTAMLTEILIQGGMDPSAIIGGKLPMLGANSRIGHSETMVVEACEYVDTFLQLHPAVSVILNIDADHLDYFKTVDNIVKSFHQFASQTSQLIVVNGDNERALESVKGIENAKIVTFGMRETNDYYPTEMNEEDTACEDFTLTYHGEKLGRVNLIVPGEHNMLNAIAAAAAAHCLGVTPEAICSTLGKFTGAHRRFEVLGKFEASPRRMTLPTIHRAHRRAHFRYADGVPRCMGCVPAPHLLPHLQPAGGFCPGAVHPQPPGDDGDPGCAGGEQVGHPHQRPGGESSWQRVV